MATAHSRDWTKIAAAGAFMSRLRISSIIPMQADPERLAIGDLAMSAPMIFELTPLSEAWYTAMRMLDGYAVMTNDEADELKRASGVDSLEKGLELKLRADHEGQSRRSLDLAVIAALHALNWARAQLDPDAEMKQAAASAQLRYGTDLMNFLTLEDFKFALQHEDTRFEWEANHISYWLKRVEDLARIADQNAFRSWIKSYIERDFQNTVTSALFFAHQDPDVINVLAAYGWLYRKAFK